MWTKGYFEGKTFVNSKANTVCNSVSMAVLVQLAVNERKKEKKICFLCKITNS